MERIASFCVDHNTLVPGMYLSRKDGDVLTWDIRMKTPNKGSYLSPARNSKTINNLWIGGIANRNHIFFRYFAISVDITIFYISSLIFTKRLNWRVCHICIVYKQPFSNQSPLL